MVQIGTFLGWSTTWILQALKDNGTGHLILVRHRGPRRTQRHLPRAAEPESSDLGRGVRPARGTSTLRAPTRMP
ncbi:class I SAM-dependent methyltransferase [Streptomyces sp. NPDC002092]